MDEFEGVAPRLYAADAAELHVLHHCVAGHLLDVAQGDGLDGTPGVAGDSQSVAHGCLRRHGHALDGVDGRNGVGTGEVGSHGRLVDVRDVGRHFRNDGNLHRALHVGGVEGDEFGVLTHVAAHAGQSHLRA